jgi:hypothetical protein
MKDPSLVRFRAVVAAALAQLETRRQEVNDLNVFPVADGDTGDNMALTLRAVLEELDRLAEQGPIDDVGREQIVDSVARAALLGARGNSGVILSQLIRGAAEELISRPGELVDPVLVAAAMARAANRAYASVRDPAEGTILTTMREMAQAMSSNVAHLERPRLPSSAHHDEQNAALAQVLEAALGAGQDSVRRGPDLLPVLREAGVVDAGAHGLTVIFAGVIAALRGDEAPEIDQYAPARITHPEHRSSTFRYCTNFAVTGSDLDAQAWARELEDLGDSVLVVGDRATLKVHVHTDAPEAATRLFDGAGTVSHLDVADMHEQVSARSERLSAATGRCGVLAVVSGRGMARLFADLNVETLDGGPTLNPSTYELLAAIHEVPAEQIIVLPNSSNVFMAAERAAELSDKHVVVVPSRSQQAGLAVAVKLDPDADAAVNATAMRDELDRIRTGGVTAAARDDGAGRFRRGEAIGFIGDELVAWGQPAETLETILAELGREAELLTCIEGGEAPLREGDVRHLSHDAAELDYQVGGQPSWWWLIAAE